MEDFAGLLERDYGLKPQGKMAPMSNMKQPPFSTSMARPAPAGNLQKAKDHRSSVPILAGDGPLFGESATSSSFSGSGNSSSVHDSLSSRRNPTTLTFEDIFSSASSDSIPSVRVRSSYPVFDSPVYDDDIFGGLPGIRSASSSFDDVFTIGSTAADSSTAVPASFDDLLAGFGGSNSKGTSTDDSIAAGDPALDHLLPESGTAEPAKPQLSEAGKTSQYNSSEHIDAFSSNIQKNPFVDLNPDYNPHADYSTPSSSFKHSERKPKDSDMPNNSYEGRQNSTNSVDVENGVSSQVSDQSPVAESLQPKKSKSAPSQTSRGAASESGDSNNTQHPIGLFGDDILTKEHKQDIPSSIKNDSSMQRSSSAGSPSKNKGLQSEETYDFFESNAACRGQGSSPSKDREGIPLQAPNLRKSGRIDEFWLSIDDVKLVTQPSTELPPVRPPPVPVWRQAHAQRKFSSKGIPVKNGVPFSTGPSFKGALKFDKLTMDDNEAFVLGSSRRLDSHVQDFGFRAFSPGEEEQGSAAATASGAAVREAIEKAEAKLRQAKKAKDKDIDENHGTRNKENGLAHVRDEHTEKKALHDKEESELRRSERETGNKLHKEKESQERAREKERQRGRESELEQENERANEIAQQRAAVERANAEVREREAQRAAKRAIEARRKAERAAVERANAEARERYERAAAEKARAERLAAVEHEKADKNRKSFSREQQTENEDDLESFFRSTFRPTSAPKQRTNAMDGIPANQELWRGTKSSSTFKKVQSVPSMAEDLTSLFGGPSSGSDTFQEVQGETPEQRKIRWNRYQRTLERAAKALEEKHQHDLQIVKDQEDRQRASELVDAEIKRWAAGKEGNLRALLSTLQYVLWPECGWQPVSLTDLITASAVKKGYKKATLYVHPDKVQQKGATNQQKYIAEKVFDLLQEARNKFNSEELF